MSNVSFLEDIEERRIANLATSTTGQLAPRKRRYVMDRREHQIEVRPAAHPNGYPSAAAQQPSSTRVSKLRFTQVAPLLRFEVWHIAETDCTRLAQCQTEAEALHCAKQSRSRVAKGDIVCVFDKFKRCILKRYKVTHWTLPDGKIRTAHYGLHRVTTNARLKRLRKKRGNAHRPSYGR
jgi:hypothetical protein